MTVRSPLLILVATLVGCVENEQLADAGHLIVAEDSGVFCIRLPPVIDFGEVELGKEKTVNFRVQNSVAQMTSVAFTAIDAPFSSSLNALDGGTVFSPWAWRDFSFAFSPPDARSHLAEFQFTGGPGCTAQEVKLSGAGAGNLQASTELNFPPIDAGTTITMPLRILNTRRVTSIVSTQIGVTIEDLQFHFSAPAELQIPASSSLDLPVTFTADGRNGGNTAQLVLRSAHGDRVDVTLRAMNGIPSIDVHPLRITSDPLALTESGVRSIFMRNRGQGELIIEALSITGTPPSTATEVQFVTQSNRIPPGLVGIFGARLEPSAVGHREWSIHFTTNDPVTPVVTVVLTAEVTLVPACLQPLVAPTQVNTTPPYPRDVEISFENTTLQPCVAEAVQLHGFTPWTLDLQGDAFVVPPMSTVRRVLTVTGPGEERLRWSTYASSLGLTTVTADP
ncbi:MAG: hypothetical protein JNM17_15930 [Archangium sp.]|nr:hypothetical protein [Archangium sp.]